MSSGGVLLLLSSRATAEGVRSGALHHTAGGFHFHDAGRTFLASQLLRSLAICGRRTWRSHRTLRFGSPSISQPAGLPPTTATPIVGYCAATEVQPNQLRRACREAESGAFVASRHNVSDLHGCAELCRRCERCVWVSFSSVSDDCSWFRRCSWKELQLKYEGHAYRTALVRASSS